MSDLEKEEELGAHGVGPSGTKQRRDVVVARLGVPHREPVKLPQCPPLLQAAVWGPAMLHGIRFRAEWEETQTGCPSIKLDNRSVRRNENMFFLYRRAGRSRAQERVLGWWELMRLRLHGAATLVRLRRCLRHWLRFTCIWKWTNAAIVNRGLADGLSDNRTPW